MPVLRPPRHEALDVIHSAMLTLMSLGILAWRPCRGREARAPHAAVAMLLLATAAVWVGSFGLVVHIIGGAGGTLVAACGSVLRSLLTGALGWWQSALLLGWVLLLPGRGLWRIGSDVAASRPLLRRIRTAPAVTADAAVLGPTGRPARRTVIVQGLGTPAVTLGLMRPVVAIDARFWAHADPTERSVVLAHEQAHQRARHGVVDAVAQLLTAGLAPLPFVRHARDCIRRHLEALADDAAVRCHDTRLVGLTVGRVAVATAPPHGLGTSGDAVWRVRRLVAPSPAASWRDRGVLGVCTAMMAIAVMVVVADAAAAIPLLLEPSFCRL